MSVLPGGGRFVLLPAGHLEANGSLHLWLTLPSDLGLRGFPVNAQAAVLGDSGTLWLSNAVTHVIAE